MLISTPNIWWVTTYCTDTKHPVVHNIGVCADELRHMLIRVCVRHNLKIICVPVTQLSLIYFSETKNSQQHT